MTTYAKRLVNSRTLDDMSIYFSMLWVPFERDLPYIARSFELRDFIEPKTYKRRITSYQQSARTLIRTE